MFAWIKESNRWKHIIGGAALSLFFTFFCTLGAAIGMEFKDCHHDNGDIPFKQWDWSCWDWLDFIATLIGGILGQIPIIIILIIIL